jgi:hypothetical protein
VSITGKDRGRRQDEERIDRHDPSIYEDLLTRAK